MGDERGGAGLTDAVRDGEIDGVEDHGAQEVDLGKVDGRNCARLSGSLARRFRTRRTERGNDGLCLVEDRVLQLRQIAQLGDALNIEDDAIDQTIGVRSGGIGVEWDVDAGAA